MNGNGCKTYISNLNLHIFQSCEAGQIEISAGQILAPRLYIWHYWLIANQQPALLVKKKKKKTISIVDIR